MVDDHYTLNTDYTSVEGGALLRATKVVFNTIDLRIDDGGKVEGDANGYHHRHGYEGFGKHGSDLCLAICIRFVPIFLPSACIQSRHGYLCCT